MHLVTPTNNQTSLSATPVPSIQQSPANKSPTKKKKPQHHFRSAEADLPANDFQIRKIDDLAEMEALIPAWNRLCETTIHPNPFFDPDFLLPAISHFGNGEVSLLVVDAPQRTNPAAERVLCAVFPIKKKRVYGIPLKGAEIWKHDQCFQCTPLIRSDCAETVFDFILSELGDKFDIKLLSLDTVAAEGKFARLLVENIYNQNRSVFYRDEFTRASFQPMNDAETFINTKVAKSTRKGTQRLRRKLQQQGEVRTEHICTYQKQVIDEFLQLESSGWKAKSGTALSSQNESHAFFHEMMYRMFQDQKMVIARTSLNDQPIAMLAVLRSGVSKQESQFKIAYDENYKEFTPGLILELDEIFRLHQEEIHIVDSCAAPNHSMINRVWSDRVRLQSIVIANKKTVSEFAVAFMPLIQQFKKSFTGLRKKK